MLKNNYIVYCGTDYIAEDTDKNGNFIGIDRDTNPYHAKQFTSKAKAYKYAWQYLRLRKIDVKLIKVLCVFNPNNEKLVINANNNK